MRIAWRFLLFLFPFATLLAPSAVLAADPLSRADDPNYDPPETTSPERSAEPGSADRGSSPAPSAKAFSQSSGLRGGDWHVDPPKPRLEAEALREEIPDLQVRVWPPRTRFSIEMGSHYPLQFMGGGLGLEVYPLDDLRIEARYSAGLSMAGGYAGFGNYGQLVVGLRVLHGTGTFSFDVEPPADGSWRKRRAPDGSTPLSDGFTTSLPAAHALLVEAGMVTGNVPRFRCTANCSRSDSGNSPTLEAKDPQLFYPIAGLRYVFHGEARSEKQPRINRHRIIQVWGSVIYQPFHDLQEELRWSDGQLVQRNFLGGMGGISVSPLCVSKCFSLSLTGGYLPSPASVMFGLGFGS